MDEGGYSQQIDLCPLSSCDPLPRPILRKRPSPWERRAVAAGKREDGWSPFSAHSERWFGERDERIGGARLFSKAPLAKLNMKLSTLPELNARRISTQVTIIYSTLSLALLPSDARRARAGRVRRLHARSGGEPRADPRVGAGARRTQAARVIPRCLHAFTRVAISWLPQQRPELCPFSGRRGFHAMYRSALDSPESKKIRRKLGKLRAKAFPLAPQRQR